jgi:hypothetical protein
MNFEWQEAFGTALPAGFLCRQTMPERWLRIHSLPESKRYPETDVDQLELLSRQNAVARYTLGDGQPCTLFIVRFGENTFWTEADALPLISRPPVLVQSYKDDQMSIHFFACPLTWQSGKFDPLILAAAEAQTGPLLFANFRTQSAYSPYDGGADLFFRSEQEVTLAAECFSAWLSSRKDGL